MGMKRRPLETRNYSLFLQYVENLQFFAHLHSQFVKCYFEQKKFAEKNQFGYKNAKFQATSKFDDAD